MAKIKDNIITQGIKGTYDNAVIKFRGRTQYISKLPDTSHVLATGNQNASRGNFADAVNYGKWAIRNPEAVFPFVVNEHQTLYNAAISYYCRTNKITPTADGSRNRYNNRLLKELNLNPRQIKAVLYLQKSNALTNAIYRQLNAVSKATATRDLQELVSRKMITSSGVKGTGAIYSLVV